jgi:hypothetical protein
VKELLVALVSPLAPAVSV